MASLRAMVPGRCLEVARSFPVGRGEKDIEDGETDSAMHEKEEARRRPCDRDGLQPKEKNIQYVEVWITCDLTLCSKRVTDSLNKKQHGS